MNLVDFLLSSQENLAQVKQLIKAEGITINGGVYKPKRLPNASTLNSKLSEASDAELEAIVDTLGLDPSTAEESSSATSSNSLDVSNVPDDVLADEVTDTVTTKSGEQVDVILGALKGRSSSGNIQFELKNGMIVTLNPRDAILNAIDSNIFVKGEHTFPLRRDSLRYSKYEGTLYGKPNYSHPSMQEAVNKKANNQEKIETFKRQLRSKGLSAQQVDAMVQEKIVATVEFPELD